MMMIVIHLVNDFDDERNQCKLLLDLIAESAEK